MSCSSPKRGESRYGQFENSAVEVMHVEYEMRRYPTEVNVSVVYKTKDRVPLAAQDEVLETGRSTPVSLLCSAFSNNNHHASMLFTAKEMKFLREIGWAREAFKYGREKQAESKDNGCVSATVVPMC